MRDEDKTKEQLINELLQLRQRNAGLEVLETKRKKAEEKLKITRDFLDNIIESSLDGIAVSDNLGYVTRANKSFLKIIDFEEEEIAGKHMMELSLTEGGTYKSTTGELVEINEEFFNSSWKMTEKLFDEGKITNWESYYLRKDRKIVPVEMNIAYLYDDDGNITGSVGINRDITERKKAEKEVKEARYFLENVFKTSADGILVADNEGNITMVNEAVEKMLGYPKGWLIGKGTYILSPKRKEYAENGMIYLTKLFEEEVIIGFEFTWMKSDGSSIDVEVNGALLKDNKGNLTGSVTSIRDITERRKAEREIKKARDFLESVIENSKDGILVVDEKGYILSCNSSMVKMSGFSKKDMLGKHASILTINDTEMRKRILEDQAELFEKGFATYEAVFKSNGGNYIDVECTSSMIKNEKGDYSAGVSIIRDISDRKRAEKEIKKTKEFLENVIESSRDGIVITDKKGNILSFNTAMEKMCRFNKNELIGKHISIFATEDKSAREKVVEKMEELFEKGFATYETMHKTKEGNDINVECNSSMIKDEKGNYIAGVDIIRDITERKKMEQQLLQSEKLKSLGELAGGVSHDFNNILAAILGRVQLLRMNIEPPPDKQERRKLMYDLKKGLEVIEKAAKDGAETVRRIQEFSRRRTDDKDFTQVDINELIENALEFTKMRWKDDAESKGIKIIVQKDFSSLPPTTGSGAELREVFTNLINNALDAMPQGGHIKIKSFKENNSICVKVKDTGAGIPKTLHAKIFDPFFTTKGVQSSGLGLSVSYGIINRHRGTITVDSIEGEGTTFTIKLPISVRAIKGEKVECKHVDQRKARILVIEDEEGVRNVLKDILTDAGHEVEIADDGLQGIEIFEKEDFDLVFTDLGMPVMSGWQVTEKIKSINVKVPVALITGWNIELKELEMRGSGVDLIIHKPFEVNQVLKLVQEGMELRDRFKAA